jgi:hypothetical protein
MSTPIPMSTITPTAIQAVGTLRRYAAIANPTIRMRKPMRYVANEDMKEGWGGDRCWVLVVRTPLLPRRTHAISVLGWLSNGGWRSQGLFADVLPA